MDKQGNKSDRHKRKTVSFRIPDFLMDQLRQLANQNRRTLSGEAQLAFENHLKANGHLPLKKRAPRSPKNPERSEDDAM